MLILNFMLNIATSFSSDMVEYSVLILRFSCQISSDIHSFLQQMFIESLLCYVEFRCG